MYNNVSCEIFKLHIFRNGDISTVNTQAIVNPTNEAFNDINPLSEKILHRAGPALKNEISTQLHS